MGVSTSANTAGVDLEVSTQALNRELRATGLMFSVDPGVA